jgi:hypothetical protein
MASQATHLVMVACHSTLIENGDHHVEHAAFDEQVWHMLDYQRGQGLPQSITAHIVAGVEVAAADPRSLLMFSGGETRGSDGTGPWSEGSSYFRAADALNLWTLPNTPTPTSNTGTTNPLLRHGSNNNDIKQNDSSKSKNVTANLKGNNMAVLQHPDEYVRSRTVTEEFATDSFENL